MSKVIRVIVLCPNGRREIVNLTPNSCILQILEEACKKQNLNPDDFDLCHYKKPLDLTLPVRFANLPNNAQLELKPAKNVRKDCLVTIGLQLESGERIMKDFVPSSTVWDVVEQCLRTKSEEISHSEKGEPVCIYMRQKLIGDELKSTTLRGLGLTKGSAIIRLMYRDPKDLSDQAHISAPLTKPKAVQEIVPDSSRMPSNNNNNAMECDTPVDELKLNSAKDSATENKNIPIISPEEMCEEPVAIKSEVNDNMSKKEEKVAVESSIPLEERNISSTAEATLSQMDVIHSKEDKGPPDQKMELDSNDAVHEEVDIGAIHYIGGRHAVIYSLDDITDVKKADLPDEFFELTIEDAKYLMEEYKRARREVENQPLLTKELRRRQILNKLGRFKQTVIRVYFPERLVLQAVFDAQETVQNVCDFIRNYLDDKNINFYLYTAPPKEKKDRTKSLIECMLIPAAVVYFGCETHHPTYLISNLREKVSDPRAASLAAHEARKQAESTDFENIEISSEPEQMQSTSSQATAEELKVPGPSFHQPPSSIQTTEKVPKWLKLSKK